MQDLQSVVSSDEDPPLFLDALYQNVQMDPGRTQLAWLEKGEVTMQYTREQLWWLAKVNADKLQKKHSLQKGDLVLIIFPLGIEFIIAVLACWRLGVVVVSVYPPNPNRMGYDIPKLEHFVTDSGATLALTTPAFKKLILASRLRYGNWLPQLRWNGIKTKPTKNIPSFEDDSWCALEADDLALIQYTSGSTGKPKGICITHNNIRHQVTWMITGFHLVKPSPDIVSMAWTPQYHDMGLFMGYFVPIYSGGMGYVMSPLEFISNPVLWPRCLEKYKATFTCGPNFSFGLTIRRLKELDEVCDNSQLHFVAMGAEPSDITLLPDIEKWMGIPQDSVSNGYGLAEHTLIVCGHSSRSTYNGSWSIGWIDPADPRCLPVVVKIVDPNTGQECSDGEEGEIWASSVCVARGYYNKPELSKEVFEAQLPNDDRFYLRTGDLGVVSNGQLFFISRLKDLIIINGRNYAPSDIEQCCEKEFSKAIRPGCSVAFQKDEESVVLVCEIRPGLEEQMSLDLLAAQIRTFVEKEEGISISEVILLEKHGVPKTTSGKVQRHKVLELWKQDKLKVLSHAEKGGLSGAKNLKQLFKSVGVSDWNATLAENGIDSLSLTKLTHAAREQFGVEISLADAGNYTAKELLKRLETNSTSARPTVFLPEHKDVEGASILTIILSQVFVYIVLFSSLGLPVVPSAAYVHYLTTLNSTSPWIVINGRPGPLITPAFMIWMIGYTFVLIGMKWILIGRQRRGVIKQRWSFEFARWWAVQRLTSVWEAYVGIFFMGTPIVNIIYLLLGSNTSLSAIINVPYRDWDPVTIGANVTISGSLYARCFEGVSVHFGPIRIDSYAEIQGGSVVFPNATVGKGCIVEPQSFVQSTSDLPPFTVHKGVPCSKVQENRMCNKEHWTNVVVDRIWRVIMMLIYSVAVIGYGTASDFIIPAPELGVQLQTWTRATMYYAFSFMALYQLTGVFLFATTVLLKWSFISPTLTDKFATLTCDLFFPLLNRTPLMTLWLKFFGLDVGICDSMPLLFNFTVPASTAHLVRIQPGSFVACCTFAPEVPPGVAATVWDWILSRGSLRSPWSYTVDIDIPANFEVSHGTRIESKAILEVGATGTSLFTRVSSGDEITSGNVGIGNPLSTQLPSPVTPHVYHPAKFLVYLALTSLHWMYLSGMFLVVFETLRSLPVYDWRGELCGPFVWIILLLLHPVCLVLEVIVISWVIRTSKPREVPYNKKFLSVLVFVHLQTVALLSYFYFSMFHGGMVLMNLYHKLLGFKLDLFTVLLNERSYLDVNDGNLGSIGRWTVFDSNTSFNCHLASHDSLKQSKFEVKPYAIVHPSSALFLSSLGHNASVMPGSFLYQNNVGEKEVWVGSPSAPANIRRFDAKKNNDATDLYSL